MSELNISKDKKKSIGHTTKIVLKLWRYRPENQTVGNGSFLCLIFGMKKKHESCIFMVKERFLLKWYICSVLLKSLFGELYKLQMIPTPCNDLALSGLQKRS